LITIKCKDGDLIYNDYLDVEKTLFCGQTFRWYKDPLNNNGYMGCARSEGTEQDKYIYLQQLDEEVIQASVSKDEFVGFWEIYFDLSTDYTVLEDYAGDDEFIKGCIRDAKGLRVLRQDLWEMLCSFIISQRNNIPKIRGTLEKLAKNYGVEISPYTETSAERSLHFAFPSADVLAGVDLEGLKHNTGCGYRAKYLQSAAQSKLEGCLDGIEDLIYEEQMKRLILIYGVGEKVANCVVLFGLHNRKAFPIDIWIQRIIDRKYKSFSIDRYGDYAGIIQQYMFYYALNHKNEL
jgi:N-glycosylase/DNA lyase